MRISFFNIFLIQNIIKIRDKINLNNILLEINSLKKEVLKYEKNMTKQLKFINILNLGSFVAYQYESDVYQNHQIIEQLNVNTYM